ncbi:DUF4184 family protein [Branchiibius cervicis]|uniref:DUF4184 family protein n=1 Tax=Branchiibius cervicis TaxID=908252 RepID=A0ABW2AWL2_9MICO
MPFTPAHIAAVLPVTARPRRWVVPAAWVVGSVVPDLVWFLFSTDAYNTAHSLRGVVTLDLAVGIVVVVAWRLIVLTPTRDVLPHVLGEHVPARGSLRPCEWPAAAVGVVAGALTHVLWDSFTHPGRWGSSHIPLLRDDIGPLPGSRWAQYASGVFGVLVVAVFLVRRYRRHPGQPVMDRRLPPGLRWVVLAIVVGVPTLVGALAGVHAMPEGLRIATVSSVRHFSVALLATVLLASCLWWLLPRRTAGS